MFAKAAVWAVGVAAGLAFTGFLLRQPIIIINRGSIYFIAQQQRFGSG